MKTHELLEIVTICRPFFIENYQHCDLYHIIARKYYDNLILAMFESIVPKFLIRNCLIILSFVSKLVKKNEEKIS